MDITDLKPCPFCGEKNNLWGYISPFSAKIRCGNCGMSLDNSCVRTAYDMDEDVPYWAANLVIPCECAVDKDGNPKTMLWVKPTDSFLMLGHTERWNTRSD